jgi:gamma-glutamyltranspeptidase / glutathione hydrolase
LVGVDRVERDRGQIDGCALELQAAGLDGGGVQKFSHQASHVGGVGADMAGEVDDGGGFFWSGFDASCRSGYGRERSLEIVRGDLEQPGFEARGLLGLGTGAFVGEMRGAFGTETGALGEKDHCAEAKHERESAGEQDGLLATAGDFGSLGFLIDTQQADVVVAALGLEACVELDDAQTYLLSENGFAGGGVAAFVVEGGTEFTPTLVGAGEFVVDFGENGRAAEGFGDGEGDAQLGDGFIEPAESSQGGGDAAMTAGDPARLSDGFVDGQRPLVGGEGRGRITGEHIDGAEVGGTVGRADAITDAFAYGEGAGIEGAGTGVVAFGEMVVGGAVENVGDAGLVAENLGVAQGILESALRGGVVLGLGIGDRESVLTGGDEVVVAEFLGEAHLVLEIFDCGGKVADDPVGAADEKKEAGLGGVVAGGLGIGGGRATVDEGVGVVAAFLQTKDGGEAPAEVGRGGDFVQAFAETPCAGIGDVFAADRGIGGIGVGAVFVLRKGGGLHDEKNPQSGEERHGASRKHGGEHHASWRRWQTRDGNGVDIRTAAALQSLEERLIQRGMKSLFAWLCLLGWICSTSVVAVPVPVQVAEGRSGMVAAGHPDATAAGVEVLRSGGNAVDAAVAVAFALGVTEPYGSGMGGKLALVYREAKTGRVWVVEALDESSHHLDPAAFRDLPAEQRRVGAQSVAVPGLVAGILEAHTRWGSRPRAELMAPAIKLAADGFEVRAAQVKFFRAQETKLQANEELGRLYRPDGKPVVAGQLLRNPELATTLRLVAEKGADGFYKGPVAEAIVKALAEGGSPVRADDLAAYRARVTDPLRVKFRDMEVFSAPPPVSGGGVLLLALKAIEAERMDGGTVMKAAAMNRVMRLFLEADAESRDVLGDRDDSRRSWERLLEPSSMTELRRASLVADAGPVVADDGFEAMAAETTHFVVVDKAGNVVSVTQSLSNHFGSGLVTPGTGVVLNNSLSNFNRTRGNPNEVAPGRRPRTTIAPTVIVKHGRLLAGIGLPGGSRIPSAMVQVLTDYLFFGRPLDEAIAAPRFHPVTRRSGDTVNRFETEKETDYRLSDELKTAYGWKDGTDSETESFGGFNAVEVMPDGRLRGYADQRRSNTAMGY